MKVVLGAPYNIGTTQVHDLCSSLKQHTTYPYTLNLVQWGEKYNPAHDDFMSCNCHPAPVPDANNVVIFDKPRGISANWNTLVEMALKDDADVVGILNDDIEVASLNPCWLTQCIDYIKQNPKVGTTSAYWLWTGEISEDESAIQKFRSDSTRFAEQNKGRVDEGLQGFLMLIRRETLEDVKKKFGHYFDENLSAQWEDGLWNWEQYQCGWTSSILNYIPIMHWGSKTIKTINHSWVNSEYMRGKQYFHERTKAPMNVMEWTFSMGFYCYKDEPGGPWKKWK